MEHIVVDPKPADEEMADDFLDELAAFVVSKGWALKHSPDAITLCLANPAESNMRAIAQILWIGREDGKPVVTWRPIKWRPIRPN